MSRPMPLGRTLVTSIFAALVSQGASKFLASRHLPKHWDKLRLAAFLDSALKSLLNQRQLYIQCTQIFLQVS